MENIWHPVHGRKQHPLHRENLLIIKSINIFQSYWTDRPSANDRQRWTALPLSAEQTRKNVSVSRCHRPLSEFSQSLTRIFLFIFSARFWLLRKARFRSICWNMFRLWKSNIGRHSGALSREHKRWLNYFAIPKTILIKLLDFQVFASFIRASILPAIEYHRWGKFGISPGSGVEGSTLSQFLSLFQNFFFYSNLGSFDSQRSIKLKGWRRSRTRLVEFWL